VKRLGGELSKKLLPLTVATYLIARAIAMCLRFTLRPCRYLRLNSDEGRMIDK
jgi:hypothetical protein